MLIDLIQSILIVLLVVTVILQSAQIKGLVNLCYLTKEEVLQLSILYEKHTNKENS